MLLAPLLRSAQCGEMAIAIMTDRSISAMTLADFVADQVHLAQLLDTGGGPFESPGR